MRRRLVLSVCVVGGLGCVSLLLGLAVVHLQGGRLYWNVGISLPPGLYVCWPVGVLEPGMLVRFEPTPEHYAVVQHAYGTQEVPGMWMKQVVSVRGDDVWVQGTHARSWDSRHFGPITKHQITGTCTALWVPKKDTP